MQSLSCEPIAGALIPGLLGGLLTRSYAELLHSAPEHWGGVVQELADFDAAATANPETIGRCILLSRLGDEPVGFVSWDPRGRPTKVIVGHNCVVPEYRGRGFGATQLRAALARFASQGFTEATVSTSAHPFFAPAVAMYESCGFVEVERRSEGPDPRYDTVYYRMTLPGG